MVPKKEVLLDIKDLRIEGYSDEKWAEIVHGVDLTLHKGEVLGLIGESGAGKSTIGLASMGFARDGCRISGGTIEFDGMELTTTPQSDLSRPCAARASPMWRNRRRHRSTRRTGSSTSTRKRPIHYRIQKRVEAQEDAMELYHRLRLPNPKEIGFRYPHQVSGGQLQRAMTAMAMACRPDLIIFDEPTTALDVTTQIEVLAAIRDIVDQFNTAAIYITHDLAVVAQMADTIKVLLKGDEVEEAIPTEQMLDTPQEEYTKSLWAVRSFKRPQKDGARMPMDRCRSFRSGNGRRLWQDQGTRRCLLRYLSRHDRCRGGESGSGKSTTARCITGLLPPTKGRDLVQRRNASATLSGPEPRNSCARPR